MSEIGDGNTLVRDPRGEGRDLVMRAGQELLKQAEFVHQFHGRGMDGVAPEIAQKIPMLFQYERLHARPCEQKPRHHPRRAAARD